MSMPMPRIVHLIDGTYELFRQFYGIRRAKKGDPPFGAVAGVLHTVAQMLEGGATHVGVATDHVIESFRNDLWDGLQDGRRHRPRPVGAVSSAGRCAGRDGGRGLGDGRARGRRRAGFRSRARGEGRPRRENLHLDAGQGPGAVRRRRSGRADGSAERSDPRRRGGAREVRRAPGAHPGLSRPRGRRRGRIPGNAGHRPQDRGPADRTLRPARELSRRWDARPRAGSALQAAGDAAFGCSSIHRRRRAALARPHPGVPGLRRKDRRPEAFAPGRRVGDAGVLRTP